MKYSVYDISDWATSVSYSKWDIVKSNGLYYYALVNHVSTSFITDSTTNGYWGGVGVDESGGNKPKFIWKPIYGLPISIEPRVKTVVFGDGYEKRMEDGINNTLLSLNCRFEGKDMAEFSAICHFLYQRKGAESFLFTAPKPFGKEKKFKCQKFEPTIDFYENYSVNATFEEVVN
jgi:phage-related protein